MRSIEHLIPMLSEGDSVFLRGDLNVPQKNGVITDTTRIDALLPTLSALLERKARIVLATHLGRPQGRDQNLSTEIIAQSLATKIEAPISHVKDVPFGPDSLNRFSELSPGSILMLENLRYDPREKNNDLDFAKALIQPVQYYVNDAFGCCHRAHASVSSAATLRPAFAGYLIGKETEVLTQLRDHPEKPFWVISGGAKVRDKIGVLAHLSNRLDGIICGGGLANTLLAGQGIPVGISHTETDALDDVEELFLDGPELVLPIDFIASDDAKNPTLIERVSVGEDPPQGTMFLDIGPESIELFRQKIAQANTVFWNGPVGVFETKGFHLGTEAIAKILAEHQGTVVIGGGDSAAAARIHNITQQVTHVSTGGGAALEFLEGRPLPGLVALEESASQ